MKIFNFYVKKTVNWSTCRADNIHKNYNVESWSQLIVVVVKMINLEMYTHGKMHGNQEVV